MHIIGHPQLPPANSWYVGGLHEDLGVFSDFAACAEAWDCTWVARKSSNQSTLVICRFFLGWNPTQLYYGDYVISHFKDPY